MSNKAAPTKRKTRPRKSVASGARRGRKSAPAEVEPDDTAALDTAEELEDAEDVSEDADVEIDDEDDLDDLDSDEDGELRAVEEELSQKDMNARSLAIRRAIEQRMEDKRLDEDLDYLDLDLED